MSDGAIGTNPLEPGPRFSAVLRERSFVVLYGAETQSIIGDQLARVALSILVFQRTDSATATALTYAATFVPAIVGGVVLGGIGDRLPRRRVMIGCDLFRAALFAAMALHGLPIWVLVALLVVAVLVRPAFTASEVSYLAVALDAELFRVGTGLRMITNQAAQVAGFALGGILVAWADPGGALLINAATFALSALVIATGLPADPGADRGAAADRGGSTLGATASARSTLATMWRDRELRGLLALSALAGLFVVAEGLAVPFGANAGASATQTGLLMAAIPLGSAIGVLLLVRLVPNRNRAGVAAWMAVGCGLPLGVTALVPHWPLAVGCWLVSGLFAGYQVEAMTAIVHRIPDQMRAGIVGVATSLLVGAQGIGLIAFGAVANFLTPARSIGIAGLLGTLLALALVFGPLRGWLRRRPAAQLAPRPSATG